VTEIRTETRKHETPPRERILSAARELFYARGIRGVSVDDIAAAAATNKMTLYRHFASKDQLAAEYLRLLADEVEQVWAEMERKHPGDALAQLNALVACGSAPRDCGADRGCALANAAVELLPEKAHPARAVIEAHKTRQRDHLVKLCREAAFVEPERLADELFLLAEGARINMQTVGSCGPGARVAEMACRLIRSHERRETGAAARGRGTAKR
jgi:AcrR family transcriptional regulator